MTSQRTLPTIAVTLAAGLVFCGTPHAAAQDAAAQDAAAQDTASINPMTGVSKSALKSFLQRPLFDPSRRVPAVISAPATAKAIVSEEPPPPLRLLGVIHGVRDMAIVQRSGETKTTILRTGDHFGNWVATVMPPVGVRLRSGDRAFDYALFSKLTVSAGPIAAGSALTGPVDAIGMPEVMSTDWGISPN